jgi:glucose-1-phosphate thymidylyltransferase
MKAVVLAGGFAKRMWPLTRDKPKHLLPIAGRPMLDYVLEKLEPVSGLDRIFISTNVRFEARFKNYLGGIENKKKISVFVEETNSEREKLGSVGGLGYLVRENKIEDELLVIGGDNIFSFKMTDFLDYFISRKANAVALYDVKSKAKARLYGVVSINHNNKIIGFKEKPAKPQSTLVSTACYAFARKGVQNILRYLDEGNDPDKIGHFIEWLHRNDDVYGFVFGGVWFDVGSLESYDEANRYFSKLGLC